MFYNEREKGEMMKTYIDSVFNGNIEDNKGFQFVTTENIYIPIYKVTLDISKRRHVPLGLLEEMVLKLIDAGLNAIDEISGVLGVDVDLINIAVVDLFNKDLVYQSSGQCSLMNKGRLAIKELNSIIIEREQLSNFYVDSVSKEITPIFNEKLYDNLSQQDDKLDNLLGIHDIEFYKANLTTLKEIFAEQNQVYSDGKNQYIDELIYINSIDNVFVSYMKLPINIFVGIHDYHIDITAKHNNNAYKLSLIKDHVIDLIYNKKLFRNIINNRQSNFQYSLKNNSDSCMINSRIYEIIKLKDKSEEDLKELETLIKTPRKLIEGEIEPLFHLLCKDSNHIKFIIDDFDKWTKKSKFITMLSSVPSNIAIEIEYKLVKDCESSIRRLLKSVPRLKSTKIVCNCEFSNWIEISFDGKHNIVGVPIEYKVLNDNNFINKEEYYLI